MKENDQESKSMMENNQVSKRMTEIGQDLRQTAIYLGEADDEKVRERLTRFVEERSELELAECYDGTGGLEKSGLMEDVRTGKVQCVVVAGFTSFAKDYRETLSAICNLFRYLNVRFLSVDDDFDSARSEDMERIETEINGKSANRHSMEISRQRCERAKKRATEPDAMPSGTAPYGYQVVQEGEQKYYVVDPDTAPFVRMIFKWAALGLSCGQIADRMIVLGVSTPGQLRDGKPSDPSKWNAHTILKILQNPNYTGSIFIGRMQQALYKAQPRRNTDAGEWTIRKNTHEPLVTREDFDIIQKYIADNCKRGERQKM